MPLHNHLRPDENIRLAVGKRRQNLLVALPAACRVKIHPQHPGSGKLCPHHLLDLLRSGLKTADIL